MEIHGEDAIAAQRERLGAARSIGERARGNRDCDEQAGGRTGDQGTIRPTIKGQTAMPKK